MDRYLLKRIITIDMLVDKKADGSNMAIIHGLRDQTLFDTVYKQAKSQTFFTDPEIITMRNEAAVAINHLKDNHSYSTLFRIARKVKLVTELRDSYEESFKQPQLEIVLKEALDHFTPNFDRKMVALNEQFYDYLRWIIKKIKVQNISGM